MLQPRVGVFRSKVNNLNFLIPMERATRNGPNPTASGKELRGFVGAAFNSFNARRRWNSKILESVTLSPKKS